MQIVCYVFDQALVAFDFSFELVEAVTLLDERFDFLFGCFVYQTQVFVVDFDVFNGSFAFALNHFADRSLLRFDYVWQNDGHKATSGFFFKANLLLLSID